MYKVHVCVHVSGIGYNVPRFRARVGDEYAFIRTAKTANLLERGVILARRATQFSFFRFS